MRKTITVFEHECLRINEKGFDQSSLDLLTRWQDKTAQYFTRIHNGIKTAQWVGIIQLQKVTLEILPKADKLSCNEEIPRVQQERWRNLLITMIQISFGLDPVLHDDVYLKTGKANILDILAKAFLIKVDELIKTGLIKKYRCQDDLCSSTLRGRLLIEKQIKYNSGHDERFACRISSFDKCNTLNGILKAVLLFLERADISSTRHAGLSDLAGFFENIPACYPSENTFKTIKWDRKSTRYFKAISLARLIFSGLSPDFYSGKEQVFSFLFDMNKLFEMYISAHLHKAARRIPCRLHLQKSHLFWEGKLLRPDILLESDGKKMVIDAKWKLLHGRKPSDDDLKQLYAYNKITGCSHGVLLYPTSSISGNKDVITRIIRGQYRDKERLFGSLWSINLFENDTAGKIIPNKKIGNLLLQEINSEPD
jgi:5-methylcytosine-specific restriction enzyme subunit McrC